MFVKKDSNFRRIFKIPPIEWCKVVTRNSASPIVKTYIKAVKAYAPNFAQPCPYSGRYELKNLRTIRELLSICPQGTTKIFIQMIDGKTNQNLTLSAVIETFWKSSEDFIRWKIKFVVWGLLRGNLCYIRTWAFAWLSQDLQKVMKFYLFFCFVLIFKPASALNYKFLEAQCRSSSNDSGIFEKCETTLGGAAVSVHMMINEPFDDIKVRWNNCRIVIV